MECQQSDVQRVGIHNWSHTPPFRAGHGAFELQADRSFGLSSEALDSGDPF
jgi:hypothetical protein